MNKIGNINWITRNGLCVGCGVCQDACPQKAITVKSVDGVFRPVINEEVCINDKGCHRCRKVCPGGGVRLTELSRRYFSGQEDVKEDLYIGKYVGLYTGYSSDYEIRHLGASGGMTTQFLIYLLDNRLIDGAVVTRFAKTSDYFVDTFIARTRDEILSAKSSKYCPVTMAGLASQIKEGTGRYAIVGLPCHLHGLRKLAEVDKVFREKVFALVGLYCSCGRNFSLTEYVFRSRGVELKDVDFFAYREGAGMGAMRAEVSSSDGKTHCLTEHYQHYYLTLRSFFNLKRCMYCIDHFAELGDICFGDIHYGKYLDDKIGISSVVTRRKDLDDILHNMAEEKVISLDIVDKESLLASQKYVRVKKHSNPAYMKIAHILGHETPVYDISTCRSCCKSIKGYSVKIMQIWVGRHKSLHWIIKRGSKDMKNWI